MVSNCVEQEELPRYFSFILLADAYNLENSLCYLVHKIAVKLVNVPDTRYNKPNKNVTNMFGGRYLHVENIGNAEF